ncbi:MAG: trehalase family glycosidase, partial [Bacteroidota bacterium]
MKLRLVAILLTLLSAQLSAQEPSQQYRDLNKRLTQGWNTWSYGSMLEHVLLPEGLSIKLHFRQAFIATPGDPHLLLDKVNPDTTEIIKPLAHAFDGSYTALQINNWKGNSVLVESASDGDDLVLLITPTAKSDVQYEVEVHSGILWNRPGNTARNEDQLTVYLPEKEITISSTQKTITSYHPYPNPYLTIKGGETFAIYTGESRTLAEAQAIVATAKENYETIANQFGELSSAYLAIQSVLAWNTIYDPEKNRVLSPVSRAWNEAWQGYVLFNWDTYLASLLFAIDNKELAYANAIAVTQYPNENGNIGHYQMADGTVSLMSQPPIGSMIVWKIYEKYRDRWFLEEVYKNLLTWNRWWLKNRMVGDYLTWGGWKGASSQIAAWESGLDNSPMYDDIPMVETEYASLLNLTDVGLNALYTADCEYLAKIAVELGDKTSAKELNLRQGQFAELTTSLWNEEEGIYLNKLLQTNDFSERLSPSLFYPMIASIPSEDQADRLIKEHFKNEDEFYGEYIIP